MCARRLRKVALALVLALLLPGRAWAAITFIDEVTATAAAHWSDGTHTMAWDTAPTSGQVGVVCALMLTVATTFVTPTATNITFNGPGAVSSFDGTTDATVQCWSGVATGTVGNVTLTTAATTAQAGTMRLLSFSSSTGFTSLGSATPCQESASASTQHDAGCAGLQTESGRNSAIIGLNGITAAGAALTLDSTYTALTGITEQMAFGYYLTSGQETQDFITTSASNRNSATIQFAFAEDAAAVSGACTLSLLGVGC